MRAFLGYTEREVQELTPRKFLDASIVLDEVLRLMHAPFLDRK